ncbi:hypothetical protein BDW62DRAFT_164641 [Aspergillus aurantiobrunneus]
MKGLPSLLVAFGASFCSAQRTNFFTNPGSQAAQLASGNNTDDYPVYQQHDDTLFSWTTNYTEVSLVLYQNENSSAIPLFERRSDAPSTYTFDMNPDVNLTWNDVFFVTLWNENRGQEGGRPYFSSSYFRINASNEDPSPTTTSTPTPSNSSGSSDEDDGGLDSNGKVGVGVGVGVGLGVPALALAGVAAFYFRRRSKVAAIQAQQQQQPQFPQGASYGPNQTPPASELSGPLPFKPNIPRQTEPSEVHAANVGVGVQSRFQELPGN